MAELKPCPFEIQQGDCLELLKNIPDNSVDLIIADPPYGINFTKGYFEIAKNRIEEAWSRRADNG